MFALVDLWTLRFVDLVAREPDLILTQNTPTMPKEEFNPASVFAHPMQVVHAKDLTTVEKRAILRSWETDARALQRADDEGMQVGERSRLHDVEIALACLDAKAE